MIQPETMQGLPTWLQAIIVYGGLIISFISPLVVLQAVALTLTIFWTSIQIYAWFENRRKAKNGGNSQCPVCNVADEDA